MEKGQLKLCLVATALDVRRTLAEVDRVLKEMSCSSDARDTVQIVLAEVLNNIVEHAYREASGPIEICLSPTDAALAFAVCDRGRPMPNGLLPDSPLICAASVEDLPEGGFGWHLIRTLTDDLLYRRIDGENRLCFSILRKQKFIK